MAGFTRNTEAKIVDLVLDRKLMDGSIAFDLANAPISRGQVMAYDTTTGEFVKFVAGGATGIGTPIGVYTGEDLAAGTGTVQIKLTRLAVCDKSLVVGIANQEDILVLQSYGTYLETTTNGTEEM